MRLAILLLPAALVSATIAQDFAISPSGKGPVAFCPSPISDAPACVKAPRPTYSPDPPYPKAARKAHIQGTVVLWLIVGKDGVPRDVRVARTLSADFDKAAVDTVKKWKFAPATKLGEPVAVQINVRVAFRLY